MNFFIIFAASIISGLLGVIISTWFYQKNEVRQCKLRNIQQLLGNRNNIKGQPFIEAINQVFITFNDSKEVLMALKALHETVINVPVTRELVNQKLMELFKVMCEDMKIKLGPLTDSYFLAAFY